MRSRRRRRDSAQRDNEPGPRPRFFFFHDGRRKRRTAVGTFPAAGHAGALRRTDMVSAWWLIVTFMAGGMAGVTVMALMYLASGTTGDEALPPAAQR